MKRTIALFVFFLFPYFHLPIFSAASDSLKVLGDSAYARQDYERAIRLYRKSAPSAAVCYNLGNCYYRMDSMAQAVLWYERASMLSPGDADIRFNLDMARSKTIDKITPRHQLFFVGWWQSLVSLMSVDAWARLAILFFALALVSLGLYVYAQPLWLRKTGFTAFVLLFLLCVVGNVCALAGRSRILHRASAIVMSPSAVVKSTPASSGSDLFVLHEGTRVEVRDSTLRQWAEVELSDGKIGWIEKKQIEVI